MQHVYKLHPNLPPPALLSIQHVIGHPKVDMSKTSNWKGCCGQSTLEGDSKAMPTENYGPEPKKTAKEAKTAADLKWRRRVRWWGWKISISLTETEVYHLPSLNTLWYWGNHPPRTRQYWDGVESLECCNEETWARWDWKWEGRKNWWIVQSETLISVQW